MLFLKEIFCKVIFRNTNVNDDVGSLDRYSNYEILRLYHFLNSGEDSKTFIDRPIIGSLDILNDNFIKFKKENDILPDSHIEYFIQDSLKDEESKSI